MTTATAEPVVYRHTERSVLDLLGDRYTRDAGNGPRYLIAEHVRSRAGFDATRTCDFMALDLWPSSGLELHGFEVKVSRGDWLRELREPRKAATFMAVVNRWWLVCPAGIARREELPAGWGLLEVVERDQAETLFGGFTSEADVLRPRAELRVRVGAPRLPAGEWSRSFTAALMRAQVKTARRH